MLIIMERLISLEGLSELFELLKQEYTVYGPVIENGFITTGRPESLSQLPSGFISVEEKNSYSISEGEGFFSYPRPAYPYKRLVHPPEYRFMEIKKDNGDLDFKYVLPEEKIAIFDIRSCDLRGLAILDDVFINKNSYPDAVYSRLRENLFIVAVTCTSPSPVCFCTSMGIDLKPEDGYDILLTEVDGGFIAEARTQKGTEVLSQIDGQSVRKEDFKKAETRINKAREKIQRKVNTRKLPERLYAKIDDPVWEETGKRCLACGSCTQLCPTCFCFDVVEENDPVNGTSCRVRVHDSCFNPSFATVHRFNIRQSIASRYRQWLMHKFAYWVDQFGSFGCVGCGRCITWCPASIDITEEIERITD